MLAAALALADRGWHVFPLNGKTPRCKNGLHDATTDRAAIERWWRLWPNADIGVRTGPESGLLVVDVDPKHGGDDTYAELEREHGSIPDTVVCLTGGDGWHTYFRYPASETVRNSAGRVGQGLDVRGDGGYVVVPPSRHASGRAYAWSVDGHPDDVPLADPPNWLLKRLREPPASANGNGAAPPVADVVPEGKRNPELASLAGTMRRRGMSEPEIAAALRVTNAMRCRPPLPEREVDAIAASIARYEPARTAPDVPAKGLDDVLAAFQKWLFLPDPGVVHAVLGAVAANLLEGDPVWLVVVGAPGSGKSETLQAVSALPDVHPAATLTEPALLSGTSRKEHTADAKGGLLRAVGDFGLILCKDFGSVLNMQRDARGAVLAALREIYDGSWTRHVGTDGGKALTWAGKVGLLAGSTQTIDRHHAVMGAMGERFVLYRLSPAEGDEQSRRALENAGREGAMRAELAAAVAGLFREGLPALPPPLTGRDTDRLVVLATLAVRYRSAVERDGYSREVELVPDPESPARLAKALARLLAGVRATGADVETAWRVVTKCALDSIPALRLAVIDYLHRAPGEHATTAVAVAVRHPTQTTRRALEDLAAHSVLHRHANGQGKSSTWSLTGWAAERYAAATGVPEISGGTYDEGRRLASAEDEARFARAQTFFDEGEEPA